MSRHQRGWEQLRLDSRSAAEHRYRGRAIWSHACARTILTLLCGAQRRVAEGAERMRVEFDGDTYDFDFARGMQRNADTGREQAIRWRSDHSAWHTNPGTRTGLCPRKGFDSLCSSSSLGVRLCLCNVWRCFARALYSGLNRLYRWFNH